MTILVRIKAARQAAVRIRRRFVRDRRGNVAVIFALVLPLLIMITLGGVDISRASAVKMNLQDALDAATLAAARSQFVEDDKITEVGLASLQANLAPFQDITLLADQSNFRLDPESGAVVASAVVSVKTLVASIALPPYGQILDDELPVRAQSEVLRSNNRIEVALVIDNTGSMNQNGKLDATKAAAIDLINRLEAADGRSIEQDAIKISLVPFSMTVRIAQGGSSTYPNYMSNAQNHTGGTGNTGLFASGVGRFSLLAGMGTTWGGCVEARPHPYDIRDTVPSSGDQATMFVPYFSPDEPDKGDYTKDSTWQSWLNSSNSDENDYLNDGSAYPANNGTNPFTSSQQRLDQWNGRMRATTKYAAANLRPSPAPPLSTDFGPNQGCGLQPVIRLTDDYNRLRAAVTNMVATGNTNVPLGSMWGWHTLSPNAPFGDGRPYNEERLQKIIIIMTDGENVMSSNGGRNVSFYNGLGYIWQGRLGITTGNNATRRSHMDNRMDHPTAGTEDLCGNMKTSGIEIYTVAVQVDTQAQTVMRRCATTAADHYFPVNSVAGIGTAFDRIAGRIENLRISR